MYCIATAGQENVRTSNKNPVMFHLAVIQDGWLQQEREQLQFIAI